MKEGAAKSRHIMHVLPPGDQRLSGILSPLVERITPGEDEGQTAGVQLLVLVPSGREAVGLAASINAALDVEGVLLTPLASLARATRRLATGPSAIVTTPAIAAQFLSQSLLKLEAVETIVLVGVEDLMSDESTLSVILAEVPKTAARVLFASQTSETLTAFMQSHAHRARVITHDVGTAGSFAIEYVVVDPSARADALSRLLEKVDPAHATVVSAEESAEDSCFALAALGYAPGDPLVEYTDGAIAEGEPLVVLFDAPQTAEELETVFESSPGRVVAFVSADSLSVFLKAAGTGARPLTLTLGVADATSREAQVRDQVVAAIGDGDVHRELLTLAPLFGTYDPAWVAAGLLRIAERKIMAATPKSVAPQQAPTREAPAPREAPRDAAPQREAAPWRESAPERSAPAASVRRDAPASDHNAPGEGMVNLFISVGERDGARKGDLVGAIAGESGISSEKIGRITMRDSFSLVEIEDAVADTVISAITGKTVRGRVINARRDQGPGPSSGSRGDDLRAERASRGAPRGGRDRDAGSRGKPSGGFDRSRRSSEGGEFRGRSSRSEDSGSSGRGGARYSSDSDGRRSGGERSRGSFGGSAGRSGGGGRFERSEGGSRPRGGGGFGHKDRSSRSSFDGTRDVGSRSPRSDDRGRDSRDGGRTAPSGPRAIRESDEWRDRGDRLRSSKRGGPKSR